MNKQQKQRISEIRRRSKIGGEGYWMPGGMNKTLAYLDIEVLLDRIDALEEWVKEEAERSDSCTFALFGEVCDGCRCERLNSQHNDKNQAP